MSEYNWLAILFQMEEDNIKMLEESEGKFQSHILKKNVKFYNILEQFIFQFQVFCYFAVQIIKLGKQFGCLISLDNCSFSLNEQLFSNDLKRY